MDTDSAGQRADDAFFERVGVWPVRLTFLTASGLTLWGSAGAEDARDRVLTVAGRLVLLGSEQDLRAFVTSDGSSSMAGLPGYKLLQERARAASVRLEEHVAFDYRAVAEALDWPPERWTLTECAALLNALNMLADVAEALQDDELLARFDSPEYMALLTSLTFLTAEQVNDVVATLDRPLVRQIVGMGIDHVERRIVTSTSSGPAGTPPA